MTEDISSILWESAMLLLVGMSVVFVFLTILIGAIVLIEKICAKFPEEQSESSFSPGVPISPTAVTNASAQSAGDISPQLVAAITAAVHQHRKK